MQKDKIESLIGFAVKANLMLYGADSLSRLKRRVYLIIMSGNAADNTSKRVYEAANRHKIPIIVTKKHLEDIVYKQNCKVAALCDRQMSEAILKNLNENFQLYVAEVKDN